MQKSVRVMLRLLSVRRCVEVVIINVRMFRRDYLLKNEFQHRILPKRIPATRSEIDTANYDKLRLMR